MQIMRSRSTLDRSKRSLPCRKQNNSDRGVSPVGNRKMIMEDRKMEQKIMDLIDGYAKKHNSAKECGSEYIYQSDEAQIDALELVADIFDLYANNE